MSDSHYSRPESWVKDLVDEITGGAPVEVGRRYLHPKDGPIEILSGQYWGERGVSNFWRWTVIATGWESQGYGGDWPDITDLDDLTIAVLVRPAAPVVEPKRGLFGRKRRASS